MEVVIYRTTDRIPVRIAGITFWLAPLSHGDRNRMLATNRQIAGQEAGVDPTANIRLSLKLSLKEVEGLKNADGSPYELDFDPNGELTEACVDELMQIDFIDRLVRVAMNWGADVPKATAEMRKRYEDRLAAMVATGKITEEFRKEQLDAFILDGVEVDFSKTKSLKKKRENLSPTTVQ